MLQVNRQLVLVSVASSALTLSVYYLVKKLNAASCESRLVTKQEQSKIYEEKTLLDQYMLFNFSLPNELLLFDLKEDVNITNCFQFPKRVALLCRDHCPDLFFSSEQVIYFSH